MVSGGVSLGSAVLRLSAEDRGLDRDLNRAHGRVSGFVSRSNQMLATVGIGLAVGGAAALVGFATKAVQAASAMEESTSKIRVVLGQNATDVMDWAQTSATAFGMSSNAALAAVGNYANLFVTMGLTPAAAAPMSMALVELSADLASFNNANPQDVLLAMQAALVGEVEPMRRYGVALNAATVEQRALGMGLAKTKEQLTEADKVTARYSLMLELTKTAQGDFTRTSGGLANQLRILTGQADNLAVKVGRELAPVVNRLVLATTSWINTHGDQFARDFAMAVDGASHKAADLLNLLGQIKGSWIANVAVNTTGTEQLLLAASALAFLTGRALPGALLAAPAVGGALARKSIESGLPLDTWEAIQNSFAPLRKLPFGGETAQERNNRAGGRGVSVGGEEGMIPMFGPFQAQDPLRPIGPDNPAWASGGEGMVGALGGEVDRLSDTFGLGGGGGGGGGKSAAASAAEAMIERRTGELAEAFMTGGESAVSSLRDFFAQVDAEFEQMIPMLHELGVEVPLEMLDRLEQVRQQQREEAKRLTEERTLELVQKGMDELRETTRLLREEQEKAAAAVAAYSRSLLQWAGSAAGQQVLGAPGGEDIFRQLVAAGGSVYENGIISPIDVAMPR